MPPLPPIFFLTSPVAGTTAHTDGGRPIPLFRYETAVLPVRGQIETYESDASKRALLGRAEHEYLGNLKHDISRLVRVREAVPRANCHGWVFTGGDYGILDDFIEQIVADNGYQPVGSPLPGDLVVYRRGGKVAHSGNVRTIDGELVLIESKWGPFGVFLHPADCHPYDELAFYRSARAGHGLVVKSE